MNEPMEKGFSPEVPASRETESPKEQAPRPAEANPASLAASPEAFLPVPAPAAPVLPQVPEDPVTASLEQILSEDIFEHYAKMPPADRERFKAKGEETVAKLRQMMESAALRAKDVLGLILNWLKLIPGVNKYFLEQESKIKTDKVMELHERRKG